MDISQTEVFDKAKWHYGNDFPNGLDMYQGYVHTGLFIGWLVKNSLISEELFTESKQAINELLNGKITPVQFYQNELDGVFLSDDVNEEGYAFTKAYFDFKKGQYLNDYEMLLGDGLPTLYHVEDNLANFEKVSKTLDARLKEFRKGQNNALKKGASFKKRLGNFLSHLWRGFVGLPVPTG